MGLCKSRKGVQRLKEWLWRPSRDLELLRHRQDSIGFFLDPTNQGLAKEIQACIRTAAHDVAIILKRIMVKSSNVGDWNKIKLVCESARSIRTMCYPYVDALEIFARIGKIRTDDFGALADRIQHTVDVELSAKANRFVVKPFANSRLDELKRKLRDIPQLLTEVASEEIYRLVDESIEEMAIIYVRVPMRCSAARGCYRSHAVAPTGILPCFKTNRKQPPAYHYHL
jgi:DNA mismatch repair protein MSH5